MHLSARLRTTLSSSAIAAVAATALIAAPASAAPGGTAAGCPAVATVNPFARLGRHRRLPARAGRRLRGRRHDVEAGGRRPRRGGQRAVQGRPRLGPPLARAAGTRIGHHRADLHRRRAQDDALLQHGRPHRHADRRGALHDARTASRRASASAPSAAAARGRRAIRCRCGSTSWPRTTATRCPCACASPPPAPPRRGSTTCTSIRTASGRQPRTGGVARGRRRAAQALGARCDHARRCPARFATCATS